MHHRTLQTKCKQCNSVKRALSSPGCGGGGWGWGGINSSSWRAEWLWGQNDTIVDPPVTRGWKPFSVSDFLTSGDFVFMNWKAVGLRLGRWLGNWRPFTFLIIRKWHSKVTFTVCLGSLSGCTVTRRFVFSTWLDVSSDYRCTDLRIHLAVSVGSHIVSKHHCSFHRQIYIPVP